MKTRINFDTTHISKLLIALFLMGNAAGQLALAQEFDFFEDFNAAGKPPLHGGGYWYFQNTINPAQSSWNDFIPGDGIAYIEVTSSSHDDDRDYQTLVFGEVGPGHRLEMRAKNLPVPGYTGFIFTYQEDATFDEIDIEITASDDALSPHAIDPPNGWSDARFNTWGNSVPAPPYEPVSDIFKAVEDEYGGYVSHRDGEWHTYTIDWINDGGLEGGRDGRARFYIDGVFQHEWTWPVPDSMSEVILGYRDLSWAGPDNPIPWIGTHTLELDWFTVHPIDYDSPVASADRYTVGVDTTLNISDPGVLWNDTGTGLMTNLVSDVAHGTLSLNGDGSFTYTPDPGFNGEDHFVYVVDDGTSKGRSNAARVLLSVGEPPAWTNLLTNPGFEEGFLGWGDWGSRFLETGIVHSGLNALGAGTMGGSGQDVYGLVAGTEYTMCAWGQLAVPDTQAWVGVDQWDAIGNKFFQAPLTVNSISWTQYSTTFTYDPNASYASVWVWSDAGTVYVDDFVLAEGASCEINAAPTAGFTFVTDDLSVDFTDTSTDSDGSIVAWLWDFGDGNGSTAQNPSHVYASADSYSVTLTITDDDGDSDSEVQMVMVSALNSAPDAVDDSATTAEDTAVVVDVLANDTDADGDTLSVTTVTQGANGTAAVNGNDTVTYTPDVDFNGGDNFNYTISDGNGGVNGATVSITVTPDSDPPFVDQYATSSNTQEGTVSGSHTNTHVDDGSVQSITEQESRGNPRKRRSSLQHQWTFSISPGPGISLTANAWISGPADMDTYTFAWSADGSSYTDLFTVTSTSDGNVQMAVLPAGLDGTVYIRVVDSDNGQGERVLGQLSVDYLVIRTNNTPATPPTAEFTHSCTDLDCGFTDTSTDSDGSIVAWLWDFGDGNGSTTQNPSHSYATSGTYTMALTATDDDGASDTSIQDITVSEPQPGTSVHVGDLSATASGKKRWTAFVTITVHDGNHQPKSGISVQGTWSDGANRNCQTDAAGQCTLSRASKSSSQTFTVDSLSGNDVAYDPAANEETSITIDKP